MSDADFARHTAQRIGIALVEARDGLLASGAETEAVKSAADRAAQDIVEQVFAAERPHDLVLSEEAPDDRATRLTGRRVWIVDPLDGTREYAIAGRRDWAVHVALWEDGRLTCGAVYLPAQKRMLATDPASNSPAAPENQTVLRVAVSESRPPNRVLDVIAKSFTIERLTIGSAGAKTAAVIFGEADAYVHEGRLNEWDAAAPVAVALAAGLNATHLDGTRLLFNRPEPYIDDLLVCRKDLAGELIDSMMELFVDEDDE